MAPWLSALLLAGAAWGTTGCGEEEGSSTPDPTTGGQGGSGGSNGAGEGSGGGEIGGVGGGAGGEDSGPTTPERHRSTPAELAERSADAYEDNESGLVAPATLVRWLADWEQERPPGVAGDLVILQFGSAEGEAPLVRSGPGIRAYLADDLTELLTNRLNGVTAIGRSPARGVRVDSYLRRYRVDPARDFVLLVSGAAAPGDLVALSQAWLALRYWGLAHENLGLLNGNVAEDLSVELRAASALAPPVDGTRRVPELERDHFSLLAHAGTVRAAVEDGLSVLDVRSEEEFEGLALSASATNNSCSAGAPLCTTLYAGKVPGARHLPIANFVAAGERLRPLEELDAALASVELDARSDVIVYDAEGHQSAVVTFALLAVAGVPARWYASSFLEWGALNATHPEPALRLLPEDSPWRTDVAGGIELWADVDQGIRPIVFDPRAASSETILLTDRAYLADPPALPGPGDGGSGCIE